MMDSLAIVKTPRLARKIFSHAIWQMPRNEKALYLTFDDGPLPGITAAILDLLKQYGARATFFCIGKNIEENPELFGRIESEGHSIGNHTQNHVNGWKTKNAAYFEEVETCSRTLKRHLSQIDSPKPLFRPPYGKLNFAQYNFLKHRYQIVMWDVLSFDFDLKKPEEIILENVLNHAENGSVIVFHDSQKAKEKVLYVLPKVLEHFGKKGFQFKKL